MVNFLLGPHNTISGPSLLTWKVTRSYDDPGRRNTSLWLLAASILIFPCLSVVVCGLYLRPELQALLAPHSAR